MGSINILHVPICYYVVVRLPSNLNGSKSHIDVTRNQTPSFENGTRAISDSVESRDGSYMSRILIGGDPRSTYSGAV